MLISLRQINYYFVIIYMEEDYKIFSNNQIKQMDRLGINYVWRDSCVDILVELRQCMMNDYLSYFYLLDSKSNR